MQPLNDQKPDSNLKELSNAEKENLLNIIITNDIYQLRQLPLSTFNLNFLYPTKNFDLKFDKEISPLLLSCFVGKIDIFLQLLNNEEINVNLCSHPDNFSPLMVACFKGYYEISRILLEKEADINKKNSLGQAPFIFCFSRLEHNSFRYENKKICMMLVDLLLSFGADVNSLFDYNKGYTVIMKLCCSQITTEDKFNTVKEIIQFLLERGADANIKSREGLNAFDIVKRSETISQNFKDEIYKILKETKQIYFLKDENFVRGPKFQNHFRNISGYSMTNNEVVFETNDNNQLNCCVVF